jgi:hypothetical protein
MDKKNKYKQVKILNLSDIGPVVRPGPFFRVGSDYDSGSDPGIDFGTDSEPEFGPELGNKSHPNSAQEVAPNLGPDQSLVSAPDSVPASAPDPTHHFVLVPTETTLPTPAPQAAPGKKRHRSRKKMYSLPPRSDFAKYVGHLGVRRSQI